MRSTYLIVKAPPCSWLGDGRKALIAEGRTHVSTFDSPIQPGKQLNGVHSSLRVGAAERACEFAVEGSMSSG